MNPNTTEQPLQSLRLIRDAVVIAKTDPDFSGSYLELRYKAVVDKMLLIICENKALPEALSSEFDAISKHIVRFALTMYHNNTNWLLYKQKYNLQRPG
jgi:hypothetical protein